MANDDALQSRITRACTQGPIEALADGTELPRASVDGSRVDVATLVGLDASAHPLGRAREAVEVVVASDRVDVSNACDELGRDHLGTSAVLRFRGEHEARI